MLRRSHQAVLCYRHRIGPKLVDFTITPGDGEELFYGKPASELQSDVTIEDDRITGMLYYLTDFTDFSGDPEKQKGNYLALSFDKDPETKVTVTFNKALTTPTPAVLEPDDRDCVFRITDETTQTITVKFEKGDVTSETTYDLSGLVLEEADEETL